MKIFCGKLRGINLYQLPGSCILDGKNRLPALEQKDELYNKQSSFLLIFVVN